MLAAFQVLDSLVPSWAVLSSIPVLGCLMVPSGHSSRLLGPPAALLCRTLLKNMNWIFYPLLTNKVGAFEVAVGAQVLLEPLFRHECEVLATVVKFKCFEMLAVY